MTNTINLPVSKTSKILVEVGENVTEKTLLMKSTANPQIESIHIAKLLGIANHKISKYLQKQVGEKIEAGDVIAQKKGIFTSSIVRSPIKGIIVDMDLNSGILSMTKYQPEENESLFSPIDGKVTSISKSFIEIESANPIFKSEKGQGSNAMGILRYIREDRLGILDSFDQIEKSIVLCMNASSTLLVKFSVIGVLGIIMKYVPKTIDLTWMQVSDGTFEKLTKFTDKKIWMRPDDNQIVVL